MYVYISSDKSANQFAVVLGQKIVKTMYAIRANIWHDKRQAPTTKNIEIVNKKKNKTKYYQMCANIFRFFFWSTLGEGSLLDCCQNIAYAARRY